MFSSIYAVQALCSELIAVCRRTQVPVDLVSDLEDRCAEVLLWCAVSRDEVLFTELQVKCRNVAETFKLVMRYTGSNDDADY